MKNVSFILRKNPKWTCWPSLPSLPLSMLFVLFFLAQKQDMRKNKKGGDVTFEQNRSAASRVWIALQLVACSSCTALCWVCSPTQKALAFAHMASDSPCWEAGE